MSEDVTVKELEQLIVAAFKLRDEYDVIEKTLKDKNRELENINAKILSHFESGDIEKFHAKGFGTAFSHVRFTVSVPKGEGRSDFFNYLKERGIFEDMITVHSATLNSFYQAEQEIALERGDVDWKCPGIADPLHIKTVRFRKA